MEYKIEYTPNYVRKDLTAAKIRTISAIAMLAGLLLSTLFLFYNRQPVLQAIEGLEQMALQVQDGESVTNAVAAFYQMLQEGIGG